MDAPGPSPKKDTLQRFDEASWAQLGQLVGGQRQAVLATVDPEGLPYTAMVAYAPLPDFSAFLLHLSDLSAHKAHLRARPQVSLMLFQPDRGQGEILAHHRLSLSCRAQVLGRGSDAEAEARATYLDRLPGHQLMFRLGDFHLVRLEPWKGFFNAGFGKAFAVERADLIRAAELSGQG